MNVPFVALGASTRRPVRVVRRRPGRPRGLRRRVLTQAGLALLALLGVALAGAAGWIAMGRDSADLAALVDALPRPWVAADADLGEADGPTNGGVPLRVTTQPPGAHVLLDGRDRGKAPLVIAVEPGTHDLVVKHPDALDEAWARGRRPWPFPPTDVGWRTSSRRRHRRLARPARPRS